MKPLYYRRFLDDIFIIWNHDEGSLQQFIWDFNELHPSIKFTHSISKTSINFLDVTVSVKNERLSTNLYRKPTDQQMYLHFNSSHPRHCKTGIPYCQAYRYRRICTDIQEFDKHAERLKNSLSQQNYPEDIIDDAILRARNVNRNDIIKEPKTVSKTTSQTNLVLTYSSSVPRVNNILSRHFNIIRQSKRLTSIFAEPPRVVYRRDKNLKDILVRAKTNPAKIEPGCRPCGKARCKVCPHMVTTRESKASFSDFKFNITQNLNCDSSNVIYMLHCNVCGQEYIGQTDTPFRLRFNNHRYHATSLPKLPLSRHLRLPNHSFENISVTLLQSGFQNTRAREQREAYFIFKFRTLTAGINEDPGRLSCLREISQNEFGNTES